MYSKEERKNLIRLFWTAFDQYCSEQKYLRGRRRMWMLHHTKVNHLQLKFDLAKDHVAVIIELTNPDDEERFILYEKLEACKSLLENGFKSGLIWDFAHVKENGHEVCRIYSELDGANFHNKEHWPQIFMFMSESMFKLEQNFLEIRDILTE